MHRDFLALEIRRLPNPFPDRSHLRGLFFCGDLQERRRLETPDVRVRVEHIEVVQIPSERAHVDLEFVWWLLETDKEAAFAALQALPQELHREDRLARTRRPGHDVGPARDEAAVEHLVESRDARAHPGGGDHRITGGRGGMATGGGGGASAIRSLNWESQARAIFIAFWELRRWNASIARDRATSTSRIGIWRRCASSIWRITDSITLDTSSIMRVSSRDSPGFPSGEVPRICEGASRATTIPFAPIVTGCILSSKEEPRNFSIEIARRIMLPSIHLCIRSSPRPRKNSVSSFFRSRRSETMRVVASSSARNRRKD